jgi:hypothetical protein
MMCGNTPKTDLAVFSYYFKNCSDTSSIFERSLKSSCKMTDDYVQEFASTDKQRRNIYSGCIAHIQTDRPIGRSTGLGLRSRFCWVGSTSMGSQQCILGYFSFLFSFFPLAMRWPPESARRALWLVRETLSSSPFFPPRMRLSSPSGREHRSPSERGTVGHIYTTFGVADEHYPGLADPVWGS